MTVGAVNMALSGLKKKKKGPCIRKSSKHNQQFSTETTGRFFKSYLLVILFLFFSVVLAKDLNKSKKKTKQKKAIMSESSIKPKKDRKDKDFRMINRD